jgi:hypothetical protein
MSGGGRRCCFGSMTWGFEGRSEMRQRCRRECCRGDRVRSLTGPLSIIRYYCLSYPSNITYVLSITCIRRDGRQTYRGEPGPATSRLTADPAVVGGKRGHGSTGTLFSSSVTSTALCGAATHSGRTDPTPTAWRERWQAGRRHHQRPRRVGALWTVRTVCGPGMGMTLICRPALRSQHMTTPFPHAIGPRTDSAAPLRHRRIATRPIAHHRTALVEQPRSIAAYFEPSPHPSTWGCGRTGMLPGGINPWRLMR